MSADVPRAEHDEAIRAALAEGRVHGERIGRREAIERVRSILALPEAQGREPQAWVLALDSELSPEVAAKALAASPIAAPARPPLGRPSLVTPQSA